MPHFINRLLFVVMLLLLTLTSYTQNIDTVNQKKNKQEIIQVDKKATTNLKDSLFWVGTILSGLAAFGGFWLGLKAAKDITSVREENDKKIKELGKSLDEKIEKEVTSVIELKSEEYVNKYFAEKLNIDPKLIQTFFLNLEKETNIRQQPILILGKSNIQDGALREYLDENNFTNYQFHSIDQIDSIDTNNFKLIFLNNSDGEMEESEMIQLVETYKNGFNFFYFGAKGWSKEGYLKYNKLVKFTQQKSYIASNLLDTLKSKKEHG